VATGAGVPSDRSSSLGWGAEGPAVALQKGTCICFSEINQRTGGMLSANFPRNFEFFRKL